MKYLGMPHATPVVFAIVLLCAGCSTQRPAPATVQTDSHSARLLDAEVGKRVPPHTTAADVPVPAAILSGPLLTIDQYSGDAATLVRKISAANGKSFEVLGTEPRLPLFVHVHAVNKDLRAVLADIGSQFGGRADLVLTNTSIQIVYKRAKTL